MKRPRILYHFTAQLWLPFIKQEGITTGECPVSLYRVFNHPNLTTDPDPSAQAAWSYPTRVPLNKQAVRITVQIPVKDPALVLWADLARQHGMNGRDFRALDPTGLGRKRWWIYLGKVRPDQFIDLEIFPDAPMSETERRFIELTSNVASSQEARAILRRAGAVTAADVIIAK